MATPVRIRTRPVETARPKGSAQNIIRMASEDNAHIRALKEYTQQNQLVDPFKDVYNSVVGGTALSVLEPAYSFYSLMRMPDENAMLQQCIDAMVTNIDGHGYQLMYTGPEGQETSEEAQAEKRTLENLLDFPNEDYTLHELRSRLRRDYETTGNAYLEIGRDRRGRIVMLSHIPSHTMRLTSKDPDPVQVDVLLPRDGRMMKQRITKRFRRFVQTIGSRRVWFKEFGDPRAVNPVTGQVDQGVKIESSATEIIHLCQYNPNNPYGKPRWFHQLPAILGSRQAELTNLDFFKENAIPAMVLMVSGGMLTEASLRAMEEHFIAARGRQAVHRMILLEATGDESMASDTGAVPVPRVELRPLQGERQNDGLFQDYEQKSLDKIRSAFRLPPLFVGNSEDMTHATARTSQVVAEMQVFGPERTKFDEIMNLRVLSSHQPRYWAFRSNSPRITGQQDVIDAIKTFDLVGALTPNTAIQLANEFFGLAMVKIDKDWANYPFQLIRELARTGRFAPEIDENILTPVPPETGQMTAPSSNATVGDGEGTTEAAEAARSALLELRRLIKASHAHA